MAKVTREPVRLKESENPYRDYREIAALRQQLSATERQLAEAQALLLKFKRALQLDDSIEIRTEALRELCLQTAGAVWASAAPSRQMDSAACIEIVDRILGQEVKP